MTRQSPPAQECGLKRRDKRGRPEFTDRTKLKNRHVSIVLAQEVFDRVAIMAREKRLPKATVIRLLVEDGVDGVGI